MSTSPSSSTPMPGTSWAGASAAQPCRLRAGRPQRPRRPICQYSLYRTSRRGRDRAVRRQRRRRLLPFAPSGQHRSLATPLTSGVDGAVASYFTHAGHPVFRSAALGMTSNVGIAAVGADQLIALARSVDAPGIGAIVIPGGNLQAMDLLPAIEAEPGKPVIITNQACICAVSGLLGIHVGPAYGRLPRPRTRIRSGSPGVGAIRRRASPGRGTGCGARPTRLSENAGTGRRRPACPRRRLSGASQAARPARYRWSP